MASYMVPLHIQFIDKLPRTSTEKIAKNELRREHEQILFGEGD